MGLDWTYYAPARVFAEMAQMHAVAEQHHLGAREREAPSPIRSTRRTSRATRSSSHGFPTESGRGKIVPTDIVPPARIADASYPLVALHTDACWSTGTPAP
jgi:formate dehydrogenase major subunit